MLSKEARYSPVSTSEEPEEQQARPAVQCSFSFTPTRTISRKVVVGTVLLLLATVSFVTWSHFLRHPAIAELPCGTSADEARSRGCIFELTGSSWVTPECYDPVTEEEFLNYKEWRFYRDFNNTEEVPITEVRQGNGNGFFVHHDYHQAHCGFLLKKMHRAVNAGKKVDGLIKALSHTTHCVEWMLDPPLDRFNIPQFAYTKFPNCGIEGGFNLDGTKLRPESINGVHFVDTHSLPGGHNHHQSPP